MKTDRLVLVLLGIVSAASNLPAAVRVTDTSIPVFAATAQVAREEGQAVPDAPKTAPAQPARVPRLSTGLDEIVRLSKAGVDEAVIIAFVQNSGVAYHPSAQEILVLRETGISSPVLTALLQRGTELRQRAAAAVPQAPPAQPARPQQPQQPQAAPAPTVANPPEPVPVQGAYYSDPATYSPTVVYASSPSYYSGGGYYSGGWSYPYSYSYWPYYSSYCYPYYSYPYYGSCYYGGYYGGCGVSVGFAYGSGCGGGSHVYYTGHNGYHNGYSGGHNSIYTGGHYSGNSGGRPGGQMNSGGQMKSASGYTARPGAASMGGRYAGGGGGRYSGGGGGGGGNYGARITTTSHSVSRVSAGGRR